MGNIRLYRFSGILLPLLLVCSSLMAANAPTPPDTAHPIFQLIPRVSHTINRFPVIYLYFFGAALILLAVMRLLSPGYLREVLISVYDLKALLHSFNEGRFGFNFTSLLLDCVAIGIFSIFIHVFFFPSTIPFWWILTFTAVIYVCKLIAVQFIATVFFGRGEAIVHILFHLLLTRLLALILMPILFIILYQNMFETHQLLQYTLLGLGFIYLGWMLRLFFKMKALTVNGAFYVFLYLCTIEIAPITIALKDYIR
jgi:hypothetical protein